MARNNVNVLEKGKFIEQDTVAPSTVRVQIAGDDAGTSIGTVYSVPPNTATISLSGPQTSTIIVSPAVGNQLQIIAVLLTSDASLFTATVEFETSSQIVQQHFEQGTLGLYVPCNITGDVDESLTFTVDDSVGKSWFLIINYAEVTP